MPRCKCGRCGATVWTATPNTGEVTARRSWLRHGESLIEADRILDACLFAQVDASRAKAARRLAEAESQFLQALEEFKG